ncbi:hypothetical protein [Herbiconiux sp. L3-i23]|uniref:hypothetical protein n=1 Tax=Herbiconiux sp. L3-i23 TaxID=2905871 RepID=UPI002073C5D8|nr:hypothetical protein [Herbiconiux sp. L3-i23]
MRLRREVALRLPVVDRVVYFGAFAGDVDLVVLDVNDHLSEQRAEQIAADVIGHAIE